MSFTWPVCAIEMTKMNVHLQLGGFCRFELRVDKPRTQNVPHEVYSSIEISQSPEELIRESSSALTQKIRLQNVYVHSQRIINCENRNVVFLPASSSPNSNTKDT